MNPIRKILLSCTLLAAAGAYAIQTPTSPAADPGNQAPQTQPATPATPSMQQPPSVPQSPGAQPAPPQGSAQPEQAPPPQPGRPSIDDQVKMLTQELSLSTDQQSKLRGILEDQHQQAMTVVNDSALSRDDKIQKIRSLRENTITKARGIMNDDQRKKLDAMLQEQQMRQNPQQQTPSSAPNAPPK